MRKIKRVTMALLVTGVLALATACSCSTDTSVGDDTTNGTNDNGTNNNGTNNNGTNNNGTTNNNETTRDGGLVDDIGDDIKDGIDDIERNTNR